jgi:hypothetical protein
MEKRRPKNFGFFRNFQNPARSKQFPKGRKLAQSGHPARFVPTYIWYNVHVSAADPSTADPSTPHPSTADPSTEDPSTPHPSTADPSTPLIRRSGRSVAGSNLVLISSYKAYFLPAAGQGLRPLLTQLATPILTPKIGLADDSGPDIRWWKKGLYYPWLG